MSKKPIRKPSAQLPEATDLANYSYSEFERTHPCLYSYLFDETYEDGARRTTATLLFFVERGILKVCLNDRDTGRCVFHAATSVMGALDGLEVGLSEETLDWRQRRSS